MKADLADTEGVWAKSPVGEATRREQRGVLAAGAVYHVAAARRAVRAVLIGDDERATVPDQRGQILDGSRPFAIIEDVEHDVDRVHHIVEPGALDRGRARADGVNPVPTAGHRPGEAALAARVKHEEGLGRARVITDDLEKSTEPPCVEDLVARAVQPERRVSHAGPAIPR